VATDGVRTAISDSLDDHSRLYHPVDCEQDCIMNWFAHTDYTCWVVCGRCGCWWRWWRWRYAAEVRKPCGIVVGLFGAESCQLTVYRDATMHAAAMV